MNTQNRRCSFSLGSYSVFGMNVTEPFILFPISGMNRMNGIRFTRNTQNTRPFGKFLVGNPMRPPCSAIFVSGLTDACADVVVLRSPPP